MARTAIGVTVLNRFAPLVQANPTNADTVNGNVSPNDGFSILEITVTAGAARTVTVVIPGGVDVNLTSPSRSYSLPGNGVYETGEFPTEVYGPELLYTASGSGVAFRVKSLRANF